MTSTAHHTAALSAVGSLRAGGREDKFEEPPKPSLLQYVGITASEIEFICLVRSLLKDGPINMAGLRTIYKSILQKNGVPSLQCERGMKKKLISYKDDIHFMKP